MANEKKYNMLEYAKAYLALGFHVMPVEWRTNISQDRQKRPLVKWKDLEHRAPTVTEVEQWWAKWPEAGIGFVMGSGSGFLAVDIESLEGLEAFKAAYGEIPGTLMQKTGKPNGFHMIFRHPRDGLRYQTQSRVLKDVDTRADGGYIVAAPSMHPSGRRYEWVQDFPACGVEAVLDLPKAVASVFKPYREAAKGKQGKGGGSSADGGYEKKNYDGWYQDYLGGVDEGQRNDWAAKLTGWYLRQFDGDVAQVKEVMKALNERNRPPLDWKELEKTIDSISSRHGTAAMGGAVGEDIDRIEILNYPDGQRKYNVYLEGRDGYAQMSLKELGMFSQFKWKFGELAGYIPQTVKQDKWEQKVNKALGEAKVIFVREDETSLGMVLSAIDRAVRTGDLSPDPKHVNSRILVSGENGDRRIYLKIGTLMTMLKFEGDRLNRREVGEILRKVGFQNNTPIRSDVYGSQRCWSIPMDLFAEKISDMEAMKEEDTAEDCAD